MDLDRFGQEFRQLRERRGSTQDGVISKSKAYKDARTLRKIEAGKQQPGRDAVILLLNRGLDERDLVTIDRFLHLAGYEPLRDLEVSRLGLARPVPADRSGSAEDPKPVRVTVGDRTLTTWQLTAALCTLAAIIINLLVRDPFIAVTTTLYAVMYADSVLLECAHEFRDRTTIVAAVLAFAVSWLTSSLALWADLATPGQQGLWVAITVLVIAAVAQWLLVQPALPSDTIVPTTFQSQTGRAAHLKNTIYFLFFFAIPFWALPVHCAARRAGGIHVESAYCLEPKWLMLLLVVYVGASVPMGHVLLTNLKTSAFFNRYLLLFFARAIVFFLLCIICLIWYSSSA